jgi:tetratricopeptide (TPR) repeat protein
MVSLARVHKYLYEHRATGSQSLERIVHLMTEALTLTPLASSGPALFLLGDAYRFLYVRRDDSRFLREALVRLAVALEPGRNLPAGDRLDTLIALGVCYFEAYNRYKRMEDLDRAVETFKRASEESGQSTTFANVANVLYHKYKETGDTAALDEAIEFYGIELAVTENPETKRGIGRRYFAYGKALSARFGVKRDIGDLERAVEFYERAVRRAGRDDLREWATTLERARERLERTIEERRMEETVSPPPQLRPRPLPVPPLVQFQLQTRVVEARMVDSPEPMTPTTPTTVTPFSSTVSTLSTATTRATTVESVSAPNGPATEDGNVDTTPKPRPRVLKKASSILSRSTSQSGRSKASKMPTLGTLPQKQPVDMSALDRALNVIGVHSKWTRGR